MNRASEGSRNERMKKDKNLINGAKGQSGNSYSQSLQEDEANINKMMKKTDREGKVTARVYRNPKFKTG
jgi:hypothetical protein